MATAAGKYMRDKLGAALGRSTGLEPAPPVTDKVGGGGTSNEASASVTTKRK